MFEHVEIKVNHFEACCDFYRTVLSALNIEVKWSDDHAAGFGTVHSSQVQFLIEQNNQAQVCHLAFSAPDQEAVHAFHQAGIRAGHTCNGAPGFRPEYSANYYAAFLLDPDGNNIEALVYLNPKDS